MGDNNPHAGHRARLRKRLLETGAAGFSDHELLELLLFTSIPRANTNLIAHALIEKYGSIQSVLEAPANELKSIKGIGDSSAALIKLVDSLLKALEKRFLYGTPPNYQTRLDSFFASAFAGEFIVIYVGPNLGIVGSRCEKAVHLINGELALRELLTDAVYVDAKAVIIGISHGNSLPLPDDMDYTLIKMLRDPLKCMDTDIADVIIYGGGKTFSMSEKMPYKLK